MWSSVPGAERADDLVEAGADPGHLGLGDPGVDAHRRDQVVHGAGRDAVDVGLHHHRVQGLVDAPSGFEDRREERALAELGDPQLDVTGLGRQHPRPVTVAFGDPGVGAFVAVRRRSARSPRPRSAPATPPATDVTDQIHAVTGTERIQQLGQGRLGQGHRWFSFSACLVVHTEDPADGPYLTSTRRTSNPTTPRDAPSTMPPNGLPPGTGRHAVWWASHDSQGHVMTGSPSVRSKDERRFGGS